jgi:RNA polymerase sigma-70 factor (ECF subfamily)
MTHTEQDIIDRLRNRDQRGLTYFYEQYAQALMGIIGRIIQERTIAEEVMQQTLLKVWNKIDQYEPEKSALYTWSSVIARNTALDKVRLAGYKNQKYQEDINDHLDANSTEQRSGDQMDTHKLLAKLEVKHRVLIEKMYLQGYSQRAISEEMDIPLGTVKTRLRSAITLMRQELKNEKGLFIGCIVLLAYIIYKLVS